MAKRLLAVAKSMLGQGEFDKQNDSPQIRHWLEVCGFHAEPPVNWCSLWCSFAYLRAYKESEIPRDPPFKLSLVAKQLTKNIAATPGAKTLAIPEPGAVICWNRGVLGWQGHVEIVKSYRPGQLVTYSGNSGPVPSTIHERSYRGGDWRKRLYRIVTI